MLALHFTTNRWFKGQPFKQLQEAAIHLDAHRLHRWVLGISDPRMPYVCINFLHRHIKVRDLKARTHTCGPESSRQTHYLPPLSWFAGNDLNMACERARVTIDEAPSSPVTHKVSLPCQLLTWNQDTNCADETSYPSVHCILCCSTCLVPLH